MLKTQKLKLSLIAALGLLAIGLIEAYSPDLLPITPYIASLMPILAFLVVAYAVIVHDGSYKI